MIVRTLAAAIALSVATSAIAQAPPQPPPPALPFPIPLPNDGTEQERAACHPDVMKFCKDAVPDTFRILGCLQSNRPRISIACRGVLASHGV
jgi:hypothetical protein